MDNVINHYKNDRLKSLVSSGSSHLKRSFSNKIFSQHLVEWSELCNRPSATKKYLLHEKEDPVYIVNNDSTRISKEFDFVHGTYEPGQREIYQVYECYIIGDRAVFFDYNGDIILAPSGSNKDRFLSRRKFLLGDQYRPTILRLMIQKSPNPARRFIKVFPLVSIYRQGYYFWLLEYLPKLRSFDRYVKKTQYRPDILIQPDPPAYMTESLNLAGYDTENIIEWDGVPTHVESAVMTQHRMRKFSGKGPEGFDYNPSINDIQWVRDRLTSMVNCSTKKYSDRIYISRQQASRGRYVENYDSLMRALSKKGFESFILENHSFEEQVKICSNAKIIIGPHGAGLTNMIFARNASILEIFNNDFIKPPYYLLSQESNHDYYYHIGEAASGGNIRVDIEEILNTVDGIL